MRTARSHCPPRTETPWTENPPPDTDPTEGTWDQIGSDIVPVNRMTDTRKYYLGPNFISV